MAKRPVSRKSTASTAPKADVYERVTTLFVEALENATSPTEWPWVKAAQAGAPINVVSKKGYRGLNRIMLGAAVAAGESRYFASFRQWQEKGAKVMKGAKGHLVVYWGELFVDANGDRCEATDPGARKVMYPKASFLFSASQVEGWTAPEEGSTEAEELAAAAGAASIEEIEAFVSRTGATIVEQGASAFYRPATDTVTMPTRDRFRDTAEATATEHFYSTLMHELVHWTGAKGRLDRLSGGRFGSESYAMEELVAEIGSAFLAADLGLSPEPRADNVAYVANWLAVLKNDRKAIFTASSASTKAAEFLHNPPAPAIATDEAEIVERLAA